MTNADRAQRALHTLAAYCDRDGQDRTEMLNTDTEHELRQDTFNEVVSDLLCDLNHLALALDVSADWTGAESTEPSTGLVGRALDHWYEEWLEERGGPR